LSYIFNIPYRNNHKLKQVIEKVKENKRLQMYWKCSNVMAIERMGYTDASVKDGGGIAGYA